MLYSVYLSPEARIWTTLQAKRHVVPQEAQYLAKLHIGDLNDTEGTTPSLRGQMAQITADTVLGPNDGDVSVQYAFYLV